MFRKIVVSEITCSDLTKFPDPTDAFSLSEEQGPKALHGLLVAAKSDVGPPSSASCSYPSKIVQDKRAESRELARV